MTILQESRLSVFTLYYQGTCAGFLPLILMVQNGLMMFQLFWKHAMFFKYRHVAALSFEQLMKKVKAQYVLGLTATPVRKDGHHPIIIMQCGPIRYRYSGKEATADSSFNHVVRVRPTGFQNTPENDQPALYEIYQNLLVDETRNGQICKDILESLKSNRSPLLLTERTEHLHIIADLLAEKVNHYVSDWLLNNYMVGAVGFEPTASCSQGVRP
jgi:hypothetical protein